MVIQLKEVVRDADMLQFAQSAIAKFACKDKDVEGFLKGKAFDFERRDKSRTYLVFDDCGKNLVGYYSLSLKALPFGTTVSKNTIKNIDGFSKDVDAAGIILIGQFGKDCDIAHSISGSILLNTCMETIYAAQNLVGGRFVMLECHDIDKVVSFYTANGFQRLQYDPRDKYLQMIRRL